MATGNGHAAFAETKPIALTFKNLNVELSGRKILDDVSGAVKPGQVLAVMGPSGSGKTTLLNFLAGRKVGDVKSGEVLLNGRHITKKLKRKICYVLQEDLFFDNLTLKETLTYSALLRLPDKMPKEDKLAKVDEIIDVLDIKKCADTKIGNAIARGLSGGEKKRANIGCELITNPSLLLLDEPTSGLDSNNAFNLVKTLETYAVDKSKTVVMTIHQPSSQIFYLFDQLLLMVNGKVAYYGKASEVLNFFETAGFHCEEHFNPADFVLEVLSRGGEVEEQITATFQKQWAKRSHSAERPVREDAAIPHGDEALGTTPHCIEAYGLENMGMSRDQGMIEVEIVEDCGTTEVDDDDEEKWPTGFWTQFCVLSHRTFKQSRSVIFSKLDITQNLVMALMLGSLWFQIPHKEETIQDRKGLIFFVIMYWATNPMFRALLVFPSEEVVIRKERAAGSYRLSAYFFAKCLSEVPLVVCQPTVFLLIFYWMCGLNPSVAFLGQAVTLIMSTLVSESVGMAIGAIVLSFDKAIVVATLMMMAFILLGGFYLSNIPVWLDWVKYISYVKYSYECSLALEFTGIAEHSCAALETKFASCKANGTVITGEQILSFSGVQLSFGENILVLLAFIVVYRIIAYVALRCFHKPS